MATASATTFTYDAPTFTRVHTHVIDTVGVASLQPTGLRQGPASPLTSARGTSTTTDARSVATKGISRLPHGLSLDDLSAAARVYDRGGLTAAGRSLTKHGAGARSDSIGLFPQARGNPLQINEIAHTQVDDILTHPGSRVVESYSGRFGDTVQIIAPDGRGVVFDSSGTFLYFGEFPP